MTSWWFPTLGLFVSCRQREKMTRSGLKKPSVLHTQCSPFTNGNAPPPPGFVVLCAPLLCQCGLVRKTEPHHGRGSVTEVMKEGGKVRKGRTVVHETTQSLAKAGSCPHVQHWRDSGRRPPPEGPPSRAEPRNRAVSMGTTEHAYLL